MVVLIDIFFSVLQTTQQKASRHLPEGTNIICNLSVVEGEEEGATEGSDATSLQQKRVSKVCNRNYFNFQRYYDVNNMTDSCGDGIIVYGYRLCKKMTDKHCCWIRNMISNIYIYEGYNPTTNRIHHHNSVVFFYAFMVLLALVGTIT